MSYAFRQCYHRLTTMSSRNMPWCLSSSILHNWCSAVKADRLVWSIALYSLYQHILPLPIPTDTDVTELWTVQTERGSNVTGTYCSTAGNIRPTTNPQTAWQHQVPSEHQPPHSLHWWCPPWLQPSVSRKATQINVFFQISGITVHIMIAVGKKCIQHSWLMLNYNCQKGICVRIKKAKWNADNYYLNDTLSDWCVKNIIYSYLLFNAPNQHLVKNWREEPWSRTAMQQRQCHSSTNLAVQLLVQC